MSETRDADGSARGAPVRRSVLVVEDEPLIRHVIADLLQDDDFDVVACESGAEAISALRSGACLDAALLDVDLEHPGAGFDVARCARETRPELLVVYTSGAAQPDFESRRVQGALFVPKPYAPERIGGLIRAELARGPR